MTRHEPLTDLVIKRLVADGHVRDLRDVQPGLILTVQRNGEKVFNMRYRYQGKQRRLVLGTYPALTLAKARVAAGAARSGIKAGQDPVGEMAAAKAVRTDTVAALATAYLEEHAYPHKAKTSADEDARKIEKVIIPLWGDRPVRTITRADVKGLLRSIRKDTGHTANRTLSLIHKMFNFAIDDEWIEHNPATRLRKLPEQERERVLTDEELRRIWRCLSNLPTTADRPAPGRPRQTGTADDPLCPVSAASAAMLKVRLLTAQRGGEVVGMKWSELDLKGRVWELPPARTKNRRAHRVPLTQEVLDILTALPQADDDGTPLTYVFTGLGGSSIVDRAKKAPRMLADTLQIDFRGHDFRRTAATRMGQAGLHREDIAFVLNHVQGGARSTRVYDRYNRDREKRVALETWARVLTDIIDERSDSTVLPFTKTGGS